MNQSVEESCGGYQEYKGTWSPPVSSACNNRRKSCVYVLVRKLDTFSVGVGIFRTSNSETGFLLEISGFWAFLFRDRMSLGLVHKS